MVSTARRVESHVIVYTVLTVVTLSADDVAVCPAITDFTATHVSYFAINFNFNINNKYYYYYFSAFAGYSELFSLAKKHKS